MWGEDKTTLYARVKARFELALSEGRWRAGDMLPSERALAVQFGVSTGTLRKAFDALEDEGVLVRIQGRGTFVKSYAGAGYRNAFHRFFNDDLEAIVPFSMRPVLWECLPARRSGKVGQTLGLSPETPLWHAIRVYAWRGDDVGISELWLEKARFQSLTAEGLARHAGSLYEFYELQHGVTIVDVEDRIKARAVTARMAQWGAFRVGAPCLELTRVGRTFGGVPVEYRLSYCINEHWHMRF